MIEYKGYVGRVEFDDAAGIFHGEIVNIRDVVTFQGKSVAELKKAFQDSVNDYLAFCAERGEDPDKPFSGQFVTRIPADLHRQVNLAASLAGQSLNAWVAAQLEAAVTRVRAGNGERAKKPKAAGKQSGGKAAKSTHSDPKGAADPTRAPSVGRRGRPLRRLDLDD